MLPCKEIVKILNSEEDIPFYRRAELKMHLLMCKHCSAYSKQLGFMKKGFKLLFMKLTKTDPKAVEKIENETIEKFRKTSSS